MPHRLIQKLNALASMDFPSQLQTPHQYLNKGPLRLPEPVEDLVDEIVEQACSVLGTHGRARAFQERVLKEHGYVITYDGPRSTCSCRSGVIHTAKGLIHYF